MPKRRKRLGGAAEEEVMSLADPMRARGTIAPEMKSLIRRMDRIGLDQIVDNSHNPYPVTNIEPLADDIRREGVLQNLVVVPIPDEEGNPSGMFEVLAGSRRLAAIRMIVSEARKAGDRATAEEFSSVWAGITSISITEEQRSQIIEFSNITARQLGRDHLFRVMTRLFEKDGSGGYVRIPKGENKLRYATDYIRRLGYDISQSRVRDYFYIMEAHNPEIAEMLADGKLSFNDARRLIRLENSVQDEVLPKWGSMSPAQRKAFIEANTSDTKASARTVKGADVIAKLSGASRTVGTIGSYGSIDFSGDEKERLARQLDAIEKEIAVIRKKIEQ